MTLLLGLPCAHCIWLNFLQVEFSISEVKRTGLQSAVSIKVVNRSANSKRLLGFVATLKDNFGFIETANHDQEIFFHYRYLSLCNI